MNQNADSTNWMDIRIRHRQPPAELQTEILKTLICLVLSLKFDVF